MVTKKARIYVVFAVFILVCAIFVLQLVKLQLVDGEDYVMRSMNSVITKTTVKAPRGDILDRYCTPIVQSETVMIVEIDKATVTNLNSEISELIKIFEKTGDLYYDTFPISKTEPYIYDENFLESKSKVSYFREFLSAKKIDTNLTASETLDALIKYYKLTSMEKKDAIKIVAVRYEIEARGSSTYYTFASDISIETATVIKENSEDLPGIYISVEPVRTYSEEYFASHIIGNIGIIYAEEYETLKAEGYSYNDFVGKDGIEKYAESYLRGTNGYRYTARDSTGSVVEVIEDVSAIPGNDVILTISTDMQIVTEQSLEKIVAMLKEQNGEEAATSATAIFMDINTAEILSMASYPTYNLETYNEDFNYYTSSGLKPYVNRAISGLFPPGSTFKTIVSVAAMEEGIITPNTILECEGVYTYYDTYQPSCYYYRQYGLTHGKITVKEALMKSCNCFFFEVGRLLTIENISKYGKLLGFGEKTGIDLYGESKGILASRENREASGELWQYGETLMAAIGQSDNAVTPLQLVNAVATIANGGTRYKPHIIKSVRDRESGELIMETEVEVLEQLDLKSSTVDAVIEGLRLNVVKGGSAYDGFKDFDIVSVGVKTGTAEVSKGLPTALMVGVAPIENPQIAFVVVTENGGTNAAAINAELVKDVLSYYFKSDNYDEISSAGELIQ
ncbi:MAG: hypothetical protein IJP09_01265 [Clostridia bacterium]|nr:hypothetical protein [Clostridia bacterium]